MPKLMALILLSLSVVGISGCSSSECRKVQSLEKPAFKAFEESEKSLEYWQSREASDLASEIRVCRDKGELNSKTLQFEKVGEICDLQTGVVSGTVLNALRSAEARYQARLSEWKKIVKLYPNCFDPEKVIRANS